MRSLTVRVGLATLIGASGGILLWDMTDQVRWIWVALLLAVAIALAMPNRDGDAG